jgi:hypothetical protein
MIGNWISGVPGSFTLLARRGHWWRLSWRIGPSRAARRPTGRANADEKARRFDRFRYHLGRGRRARESGRFQAGATEARRALALYPSEPWALALLGQCLFRQRAPDLDGARRALQRAWTVDPTNGYFVGLLLDVLKAQGDEKSARDLLEWAWWRGAPVERWLPYGPPMPTAERHEETAASNAERESRRTAPVRRNAGTGQLVTGRQPIPA